MTSIRLNLLAGLGGRLVAAVINLAAVPLFLHYLGVAAWGLVTLYVTLQSLAVVFDLGLSLSLNRELALTSGGVRRVEGRALLAASEVVYWSVSILFGTAILLSAGWLTDHWINLEGLDRGEAVRAFAAMGMALAVQLPSALYTGGLQGMQRQVGLNLVTIGFSMIRAAVGVAVLAWIMPTADAFLTWQAIAALGQTLALAYLLRRAIPGAGTGMGADWRLGFVALRREWRFVLGANLLGILGAILLQADKVVLARVLPLDQFGVYALASLAASLLAQVSGPVFAVYQPRLTQMVGAGDQAGEIQHYHRYAQIMAVLVIPFAVIGAIYGEPLLALWTRKPELANAAALPFALLTLGWGINALATVPGTLQLTHGITGFGVRMHAAAIVLFAPWVYFAGQGGGPQWAAAGWILINLGYLFAHAFRGSWRLLPAIETRRWLIWDLIVIVGTIAAVGLVAARTVPPAALTAWTTVPAVAMLWAVTALAGVFAGRETRGLALSLLSSRRGR